MHANVTVPAAIVMPEPNDTVKTLLENEAVLVFEEGAVNVHTGVDGQENPAKVINILPAADIIVEEVKVTVTITFVEPPMLLDSVIAPFVNAPVNAERVAVFVTSISLLLESCVFNTTFDNAF